MRHFRHPQLQLRYRSLLFSPPTRYCEHKGREYRTTSRGMSFPFWVGFDHPDEPCPYIKGSPTHASWAAGVDYRRLGGRDYPKPN